jgi:PKD repeat protein
VNEIRNNRPSGTSGPLKIQLVSTPEKAGAIKDGEALAGTVAFSFDVPALQAGFSQVAVTFTGLFTPMTGSSFNTLVLVETVGGTDLAWDGQPNVFRTIFDGTAGQFALPAPEVLLPAEIRGRVGAPFSLPVEAENTANGYTATVTGLPKGLVLSRDRLDTSKSLFGDPFLISGVPSKAGTYPITFTVSAPDGVSGSATANIVVTDKKTNSAPNVVDVQALPDRAPAGTRLAFVAAAEDPENSPLAYSWNFGDGGTALGQQTFHTFINPGMYTVTLTASDGALSASSTVNVEITGTPSLRPVVDLATAAPNPATPGAEVTLTATASDPQGLPLTLRWNFGDGTAPQTGNPVTHVFTNSGDYVISVTAINFNGLSTTFSGLTVFVPGATDAPYIDNGLQRTSADDLSTTVQPSLGGVVGLLLGSTALGQTREDTDFFTAFEFPTRSTAFARGPRPTRRFQRSGVYRAASRLETPGDSAPTRKTALQVPISSLETKEPGPEDGNKLVAASRRTISLDSISGKFTFRADANDAADSVKLGASIEIPPSVDPSAEQEFSIGIGAVIDRVRVANGKMIGKSDRGIIKKVSLRAAKDKTLADGLRGKLSIELNAPNLDSAGFEVEGVSLAGFKKGKTNPEIQVSIVYAGISYKTIGFPVQFTVTPDEGGGKIVGRGTAK